MGRGPPRRGRHQVDYAVNPVAADHVEHLKGLGHVHTLDEQVFVYVILKKIRQAQSGEPGDDHLLSGFQQPMGRVHPDESHSADEQYHDNGLRRPGRLGDKI